MEKQSIAEEFAGEGLMEEEQTIEERSGPERVKVLDNRVVREPIKSLDLRASAVCVEKSVAVSEAIRLMREHRTGCVLVQEEGVLVGIFTERDILYKLLGTDKSLTDALVGEVMSPDPDALTPEDSIAFALNKMSVGGFRHIPLADDHRRPLGVVSVKDIRHYAK